MQSEIYYMAKAYLTYFKKVFIQVTDVTIGTKDLINSLDRKINQLSEISVANNELKRQSIDTYIIDQFRIVHKVSKSTRLQEQCQQFINYADSIKKTEKAKGYSRTQGDNGLILPNPILEHVHSYLDPKSLLQMRKVSKGFGQYIDYDDYTRNIGKVCLNYTPEISITDRCHMPDRPYSIVIWKPNVLAIGCADGVIRFCNIEKTCEVKHELRFDNIGVTALAIFSDLLFSGSENGNINIWDLTEMRLVHTLCYHKEGVVSLEILPCGWLISEGFSVSDGEKQRQQIGLWDCRDGLNNKTNWPHIPWPVLPRYKFGSAVACIGNNKIAFQSTENNIEIWSCDNNQWQLLGKKLNVYNDAIVLTSFGDDWIIAGFTHGAVCALNWKTGNSHIVSEKKRFNTFNPITVLEELPGGCFVVGYGMGLLGITIIPTPSTSDWKRELFGGLNTSNKSKDKMLWGMPRLSFEYGVTCIVVLSDGRFVIGRRNCDIEIWKIWRKNEFEIEQVMMQPSRGPKERTLQFED